MPSAAFSAAMNATFMRSPLAKKAAGLFQEVALGPT
jgi:hypothetical protein